MKIGVFSDLHVEFSQPLDIDCSDADVIVLAGDCHTGIGLTRLAGQLRQQYGVPVIAVAGNHEFYNSEYDPTIERLRACASTMSIDFLERDSVMIDDVRFLGCTLWTNFCLYGNALQTTLQKVADDHITDFWSIRHKDRRFLPSDANELFERSYAWLQEELSKPFTGKTVVVTHFAPHILAKHAKYPPDDPVSPYFISDCTPLMLAHDIDLWIFGHTHNSIDEVVENNTRLISNQRGYPNEDPHYTQFNTNKICEV